ncbi:hypothetical protein [Acetobacterium bakii]|uniref:hypothetical protein n=1 Tax=Acetobacterium bakii TaxID=52689 RepID=UPI000F8C8D6B|nr:hypothetical protein [Acetobacterium bakii]
MVSAICCALLGAAWGNAYSFYYLRATIVVSKSFTGTAIGALRPPVGSQSFFPLLYRLIYKR